MCFRAEVPINEYELKYVEMFRWALSEPSHSGRMQSVNSVRHDISKDRLALLFNSPQYLLSSGPHDYPFVKWAAESAAMRHEAMVHLMEVESRFQSTNQRKLNVAEAIGLRVFGSIQDGVFRGLHTPSGILDRIRHEAKEASVLGGRDKDTLRNIWKTYRGVVHLGMAITYLEDNPDQKWHVLQLAELFREVLSESCPKGTQKAYVEATEQINFPYLSMLKGPRFRNRGLPYFDG